MNQTLSWNQIKQTFHGKWIEIVEFEWDWHKAHPSWALVRNHAPQRSQLMDQVRDCENVVGSIVLYVDGNQSRLSPYEPVATL